MSIKSVAFDCEVLTPMFLAGADPQQPELRPPSIRGAMRWWFRAIAGGIVGSTREILEMESRTFGASMEGSGQSRILLRTSTVIPERDVREFSPLPHKNPNFRFKGIKPGSNFTVILSSNCNHESEQYLAAGLACFRVAWLLGGLGRRSRRGFGAFQPVGETFTSKMALVESITRAIESARQNLKDLFMITDLESAHNTAFPILSSKYTFLAVGKEYRNQEEILKEVMQNIHAGLEGGALNKRIIGSVNPRQASPLLITVKKLSGNNLVPVFSFFRTKTKHGQVTEEDYNKASSFVLNRFSGNVIKME